jgi:hypothetical protein
VVSAGAAYAGRVAISAQVWLEAGGMHTTKVTQERHRGHRAGAGAAMEDSLQQQL